VGKRDNTVRLLRSGTSPATFAADQATSYSSTGRPIRISKRLGAEGPARYVVPLVEGYVSLYSGESEQRDPVYYLQLPGVAFVTAVERSSSQLTLARALSGCSSLDFGTDEFQRLYPFNAGGMSRLVMAYNTCRQPGQPTVAVKRASGFRTSIGIKAGLNVSNFEVPAPAYAGLGAAQKAQGYQTGVTLNFSSFGPLSVQLEATFLVLNARYGPYEAYYSNVGRPSNAHTTQIRYAQIQVPVLLRYEFGRQTIRPFLNAGPSLALNLANESADTYPSTASGVITEAVELGKTGLGLAAGAGISIRRPSLPALSLEVRYDRVKESVAHNDYFLHLLRHDSLRLDVGITF